MDTYEGFPMVVLVNHNSASASEIVAASLQDHHRALIAGERTWGKGSVQNVIEMEGGKSILKLTTARYLRPSGHNIHRDADAKESDEWGVKPDTGYEVALETAERYQLELERHERDLVVSHSAKKEGEEVKTETKPAEKKPPFVDRQLQKAVEYLTSELAKAP